jgi:hypothetical protein
MKEATKESTSIINLNLNLSSNAPGGNGNFDNENKNKFLVNSGNSCKFIDSLNTPQYLNTVPNNISNAPVDKFSKSPMQSQPSVTVKESTTKSGGLM